MAEGDDGLAARHRMLQPVLPQDISSLARALLTVPAQERRGFCAVLFDHAALAARHVAETGQLHCLWGNGTLDAAARHFPLAKEPLWDDPTYLSCLIIVLHELQRRLSL
ncbi:hypothetical protein [Pseudophaeobacter leonis]|uniref:DUF7742 family protein n=1 Tax=Pseudophaeobacter leonis TaxID=1144477 RepID=UPI001F4E297E|nr:hypothetical protein [Pseudophaeobacter leonis]